jgi:membrane-bound lytic murein transglycosylase A
MRWVTFYVGSAVMLLLMSVAAAWSGDHDAVLQHVAFDEVGDSIIIDPNLFAHRDSLLRSIQETREYLKTDIARIKLQRFESGGINAGVLDLSLERFSQLLKESTSQQELVRGIRTSFDLYRSLGSDGRGSVFFTGYFRPVHRASRKPTKTYRYPLFRRPADFEAWEKPHPTRIKLEGADGLGRQGTLLHGHELAWLETRFEAFMIHVQGSAVLEFPDSERVAVGFAGGTDYPFKGIPLEYLKRQRVAWSKLPQFFRKYPDELDRLLSENNRFIFFTEQQNAAPVGSLGLAVVEERSIAIDQGRLPPGAVSVIRTALPQTDRSGKIRLVHSSRFVLNLDSGSAIRGPGRVDVFMGTGEGARERANHVHGGGELYYLFPKRAG